MADTLDAYQEAIQGLEPILKKRDTGEAVTAEEKKAALQHMATIDAEAAKEREGVKDNPELTKAWTDVIDQNAQMRQSFEDESGGRDEDGKAKGPALSQGHGKENTLGDLLAMLVVMVASLTGVNPKLLMHGPNWKEKEQAEAQEQSAEPQSQQQQVAQAQEPNAAVQLENNQRAEATVSQESVQLEKQDAKEEKAAKGKEKLGAGGLLFGLGSTAALAAGALAEGFGKRDAALETQKEGLREEAANLMRNSGDATPENMQRVDQTVEVNTTNVLSKGQLSNIAASVATGASSAFEEIGRMLQAAGVSDPKEVSESVNHKPGATPGAAAVIAQNQGAGLGGKP